MSDHDPHGYNIDELTAQQRLEYIHDHAGKALHGLEMDGRTATARTVSWIKLHLGSIKRLSVVSEFEENLTSQQLAALRARLHAAIEQAKARHDLALAALLMSLLEGE